MLKNHKKKKKKMYVVESSCFALHNVTIYMILALLSSLEQF